MEEDWAGDGMDLGVGVVFLSLCGVGLEGVGAGFLCDW